MEARFLFSAIFTVSLPIQKCPTDLQNSSSDSHSRVHQPFVILYSYVPGTYCRINSIPLENSDGKRVEKG